MDKYYFIYYDYDGTHVLEEEDLDTFTEKINQIHNKYQKADSDYGFRGNLVLKGEELKLEPKKITEYLIVSKNG